MSLGEPKVADLPSVMRTRGWADYGLIDSGHGRKLERYGRFTVVRGNQRLGTFRENGRPVDAAAAVDAENAPTAAWKTRRTRFPQRPQAST